MSVVKSLIVAIFGTPNLSRNDRHLAGTPTASPRNTAPDFNRSR
jgi:hypothetical protein